MHVAVGGAPPAIPRDMTMSAYPNPFNGETTIAFDVPRTGRVSVTLYNLLGEEVATLVREPLPAGSYTRVWNAAAQPSGMYFAVLRAGDRNVTRKLMYIK